MIRALCNKRRYWLTAVSCDAGTRAHTKLRPVKSPGMQINYPGRNRLVKKLIKNVFRRGSPFIITISLRSTSYCCITRSKKYTAKYLLKAETTEKHRGDYFIMQSVEERPRSHWCFLMGELFSFAELKPPPIQTARWKLFNLDRGPCPTKRSM